MPKIFFFIADSTIKRQLCCIFHDIRKEWSPHTINFSSIKKYQNSATIIPIHFPHFGSCMILCIKSDQKQQLSSRSSSYIAPPFRNIHTSVLQLKVVHLELLLKSNLVWS